MGQEVENIKNTAPRVTWVEGLKGCAALVVVIFHLLSGIFPMVINGTGVANNFNTTLRQIGSSPLNLFFDGNLSVAFFFLISGYVISARYFATGENNIKDTLIKRYFRLAPPILFSILLTGILMQLGFFFNQGAAEITASGWLAQFYQFDFNFGQMLYEGFFGSLIFGQCTYNATLWTMIYEFWGVAYVLVVIALIDGKNIRQRAIVYVVLGLILYRTPFLAYLLGVMLNDIRKSFPKLTAPVLVPAAILGLYLASYPAEMPADTLLLYKYTRSAAMHVGVTNVALFMHIVGGFLILFVLLYFQTGQKFFGMRTLTELGKISYSLYVTAFVIQNSLFCYLFVRLAGSMGRGKAFLISTAVSLPVMLLVAALCYNFIEKPGIKLANYVNKKINQ